MLAPKLRKVDEVIIRLMKELDASGVYPGIETLRRRPELAGCSWTHIRNRRQHVLRRGLVSIATTPPDKRTARWHVAKGEELERAAEFLGDNDPNEAEASEILAATRDVLTAAILRGDAARCSLAARACEENRVHKSFAPAIDKIGSMSTTSDADACRQIREEWGRGGLGWGQPGAGPKLAEIAA